ncbi:MAG: type II secretion system F family protein [Bryobacterales bacterium]|nr:type II secretion system F family protein [Bryobacteraceae bacterium]MDW8129937.1 type II secretion system F family protein [Bryobacterales bacterium]
MPALISLALFVVLSLSITAYGYRLYVRPRRLYEQLSGPAPGGPPAAALEAPPGKPLLVRLVERVGEAVPISPQEVSMTRRYLIAAGFRSEVAPKIYYGLKVVLCAAFFIAALLTRDSLTDNPVLRVVFLVAATMAGFFAPNMVLDHLVTRRQEKLRLALPDALDLMIVCMEAGLGLDQAILSTSRELELTHPEISQELKLVNLEMRAGKRRVDALKNLADRTGEPEIRKLVATLIQADRFGTSIADSLRTHSDYLRVRRRQQAEERAAKVGVKLVFPIFFFILPAMLVVAAGPGLLQLFKNLFPMMNSFGM